MKMLTPYQIELIHGEIDGENTPEASAEVRELVETQPEALALMTSLRALDALFSQVPDRAPPPRMTQLIHDAVPLNSGKSPRAAHAQGIRQTITRWAIQQCNVFTNFMGEVMLTKRVLIMATTTVAVIAIIGHTMVGYPPSVFDAGTIGAKDGMSGVQQAGRYKGSAMTESDVTLSNPEISALFQNDKILRLVKSDAFREAMRNDAFRELQASEAFRQLMSNAAFRLALANNSLRMVEATAANRMVEANSANRMVEANSANRMVEANSANRMVEANSANRMVEANAANRMVEANAANRMVEANAANRMVQANSANRMVEANDAFRMVEASDAFRAVFANAAFRTVLANDAFRAVFANDAYRQLQSSDMFRVISHSQSLSEAFLSEAMRAQY